MRDKLIELLKQKYDHYCDQCGVNKDSHYIENLADYLISNGLVFRRKWIPTNRCRPEKDKELELYFANTNAFCYGKFLTVGKTDFWAIRNDTGLLRTVDTPPAFWRYAERMSDFEVEPREAPLE